MSLITVVPSDVLLAKAMIPDSVFVYCKSLNPNCLGCKVEYFFWDASFLLLSFSSEQTKTEGQNWTVGSNETRKQVGAPSVNI